MIKVNIQDAKTHLSRYLEQVEEGEIVVLCRHNQPIAELRAIQSTPLHRPRVPGLLKGLVQFDPNAFAPMNDEELADFDAARLLP